MNSTTVTLNDFDITYYPGLTAQDVIPKLIRNLKISFANLPKDSIHYKAIRTYIRLLNSYLNIANSFSTQTTETISFFNDLSEHLNSYARERYPQYDIYVKPQGRIKSPISANTKIKQKISKYLKLKKDLDSLTISDFIAFRFVIDARDSFGNLIPESISVQICYDVLGETINYIKELSSIGLLPVSRVEPNDDIPNTIYHPLTRPQCIEENDEYIKDFIYVPKPESFYQSAHLQFASQTSDEAKTIFGELQFRTFLMNEHAERGHASHKKYKTREKVSYLAVPQILKPAHQFSNQVAFLSPDNAFEEYFGFSPRIISPFMSYDFLKGFLEENDYTFPVLPLYFKKDENEEIFFFDDFTNISQRTMPVEVVGSDNVQELEALVGNIFDEKTINNDAAEHALYFI